MRFLTSLLVILIFFFGLLFLVQNKEALSEKLTLQLDLYFNVKDIPFMDTIKGWGKSATETARPAESDTAQDPAVAGDLTPETEKGRIYWKTEKNVPFFFVVICAFTLGMLFSTCFFLLSRIRMGYEMVAKKRQVRKLEKELAKYKEDKDQMILETQALDASKQLSGESGKEEPGLQAG